MASPMVEGRVDPHKKAHYSLHISDRIAKKDGQNEGGAYTGVKYNHKPPQTTSSRTTTLTSTGPSKYGLKLADKNTGDEKHTDIFKFTGHKTTHAKSSYVLLFDPSSQKATLEPLASTYTFNLSNKNGTDVSSTYPPIYHKKPKTSSQDNAEEDLFDGDNENEDPDADNPYDFRHFLGAVGTGKGNDSEYNSNSPDYRTGTGSAMNTPVMPASRKPLPTSTTASANPKQKSKINVQPPKARKRKSPEPDVMLSRKNTAAKKKEQATPTVRLDRRASTKAEPAKGGKKAAPKPPPAAKIKSAEIVHSSDDSDLDADGSPASPSPPPQRYLDDESDSEDDNGGGGGLEIEVPDARPGRPNALKSLGLGQNLGLGLGSRHLSPDPSRGPISLASAANSTEGTPNRFTQDADDGETFDFGDIGGGSDDDAEPEYEDDEEVDTRPRRERDGDVEPMDIGPPVTSMASRKTSVPGMAVEEDEDDPLYKEMMEGLAGGDSSEESEEE